MTKLEQHAPVAIANTVGTLGYLSIATQWLWSTIIIFYPLMSNGSLDWILANKTAATPNEAIKVDYGILEPILPFVAIIITIVVIVVTIYILLKIPATVGKKGSQATHQAAQIITKHVTLQTTPETTKRQISYRITWWLKIALIITPLVAIAFANETAEINRNVILAIAIFCAVCSSIYFLLQWLAAKVFKNNPADIW